MVINKRLSLVLITIMTLSLGIVVAGDARPPTRDQMVWKAEDYAGETWICEQVNSDTEEYWDRDGNHYETNPDGHPQYLAANRSCDFRAIFGYVGVPYGWGHWHTLSKFRSCIDPLAGKRGAGNHKVHGSAPGWSTGIDCSGLIGRAWRVQRPDGTKPGTGDLYKMSEELPNKEVLRRGDIILASGHVLLAAADSPVVIHASARKGVNRVIKEGLSDWPSGTPRTYVKKTQIIAIDNSYSMTEGWEESPPHPNSLETSKESAKQLIDSLIERLSKTSIKVSIMSFTSGAHEVEPFHYVDDGQGGQRAKNAIAGIPEPGGACGTDIGAMIDAAHQKLLTVENKEEAAGLDENQRSKKSLTYYTDGQLTPKIKVGKRWKVNPALKDRLRNAKRRFKEAGFKFSSDPLTTSLLAELFGDSEDWGSSLYLSLTPEEIPVNTQMGIAEGKTNTFLLIDKFDLATTGTLTEEIKIDSSISEVIFMRRSYQEGGWLRVYRPDGSQVRSRDGDVTYLKTSLNEMYKITAPAVGTWRMRIGDYGIHVLSISAKTNLTLEFPTSLRWHTAEDKSFQIELKQEETPVLNANVLVKFSKYSDETQTAKTPYQDLVLYDDGAHGDNETNDGVYGNSIVLPFDTYPFKIIASGLNASGEAFQRIMNETYVNEDLEPFLWEYIPKEKTNTALPIISALIKDDNPLDESMIEVKLDGKIITPQMTFETLSGFGSAQIEFEPTTSLEEGPYTVEITVKNLKGEVAKVFSWTFIVDLPTTADTIMINEVHPKEKWVELKCLEGPLDISQYILWDMEDKDTPFAEKPVTLKTREFAVIHWKKEGIDETDERGDLNGNGYVDLYVDDPVPFDNDDQIVLLDDRGVIIDVVVWADYDKEMKRTEVEDGNELAKYGEWSEEFTETDESPAVMLGVSSQSIGRKPRSEDTNAKEEWTIQARPTAGEENVTSTEPPAKGTIIINELNPAGNKGDWAELYCLSGPIDIATMALGYMGGKVESLAPSSVTLNTGEYVVAHWQEGVDETDEVGDVNGNGIRDFYISTKSLAKTDDQLVLRVGEIIQDAVIWSNMDGRMTPGKDKQANKLVELGEWSGKFSWADQSDAVKIGTSLQSIGRIPNATDSNTKDDWKILIVPSPGRLNEEIIPPAKGSLIINEVYLEDDENSSWAEIYCVNGPANLQGLFLTDKDGKDATVVNTPATLETGEYAVIHWEEREDETDEKGDINGNGYRDLYLEDYSPTGTDDQLVLTVGDIIYDAVIWTNNDGKMAKYEVRDSNQVSEAKEWQGFFSQTDESKAVAHLGWYYHSIGRFPNLQDTNAKEDWRVMTPTPGKENVSEDLTPPITTFIPSQWLSKNEEGIPVAPSSITYTLSAIDLLSGVNYIKVNLDDLGFLVYTEPISFTTEGEHTIQYGAVDKAGNEEEIRSFRVIVDDTPPVLTLTVEPLLTPIGEVTITVTTNEALRYKPIVTALDSAGRRITTTFLRMEEKTYAYRATITDTTAEGEASISVVGTDLVGNMERISGGFIVDTTPPPSVTDLEAVSGTAVGTVDLSWTAPGEATTYIVKYNTQPIIAPSTWIETDQEEFERGETKNVDVSSSPGDVLLAKGNFIIWQYGGTYGSGFDQLNEPDDSERLTNGNTLITDTYNHRVIEVDSNKNIVWQYGESYGSGPNQLRYPYDAERLANGNTLIADLYNNRVIEVDSDKNIVWQYGTTGVWGYEANQLTQPTDAERLANGNTLIVDLYSNRVIEVDSDKNIIWQYGGSYGSGSNQLKYPYDAERLSNENTLITDYRNYRVIEVDPNKNIVWQYGGTSGSGPDQLKYPVDAERLASGNTLITDYYINRVIEVSPDKTIVWQYGESYGSGPNQLGYPYDAERLANGNTLIVDHYNNRIIEIGSDFYNLSGAFTSSAHDTGFPSNFKTLSWAADSPSGTSIKFQIRTASTEAYLSSATWYGPISTSDYYSISGAEINSVHNGDRWIQYKAFLETTDFSLTPVLHEVSITLENEINWDASTLVTAGVPIPAEAGTKEEMAVGDLLPGTLYYFALKSKDEAGNISGISNSPSAEAQSDVTPPVTTLTPSGPLYNDGVNDFAPLDYTYTLTATDDISGVDHIEVNIDGAGFVTYTEPISFTTEGKHTIQYKAVDKAGNWEEAKTFTVIVDGTPPKITITSPKAGEYYHTATIDVTYAVEDPLVNGYASGVKEEIVLLDGEVYKEKTIDLSQMLGEHTFTVKATDNVGNESETQVKFSVVLAAKITIKPEVLKVTPGVLTAFVEFPEAYDVAGIIDATCDGAPSEKMMLSDDKTKMIIKFERERIEEALSQLDPPQSIDTHFIVKGHFKHDTTIFIFKGEDSIKKIIEDTTPPQVRIKSPKKNQTIQGIVSIIGTVKDDSLKEYEVMYGAGYNPTSWTTILTSTLSVTNNTLATWDVTKLDGIYTLKVTASDNSGNEGEASIAVTVDNTVVLLGPVVTPKVPAKPVTPAVPVPTVVTPTTPEEEEAPTTPAVPEEPTAPEEEPEEEIGLSGTITPIPKE